MDALWTFTETAVIAVAGILIRFLIAAVGLALLALALAAVFGGLMGVRRLIDRARGLVHSGPHMWKRSLHYSPGHAWLAAARDGSLRVGLDDLAQKILPGARVLRFAPVGADLRQGEPLATLTVGDHELTIGAPAPGRVLQVNERVAREPRLLHRDPYGSGWLVRMAPASRDYERFPTGDYARVWINREDARLTAFLEGELGVMAADGGEWILPPAVLLTSGQFQKLAKEFLGASNGRPSA
jgi:glycine cleavage system H protein